MGVRWGVLYYTVYFLDGMASSSNTCAESRGSSACLMLKPYQELDNDKTNFEAKQPTILMINIYETLLL